MPFYHTMGNTTDDRKLLENILLIKGWRKYTWQEIQLTNPGDTTRRIDSASSWLGTISKNGKAVREPVSLEIANDSINRVITTDKSGRFLLTRNMVTSSEDKIIRLRASDNYHYTINLSSKFDTINRRLLKEYAPATLPVVDESSSKNLQLPGLNHVFNLQEVVIKDKPAKRTDGSLLSEKGPNDCGDYVCKENVLNCFFHAGDSENRPPIVDKLYGIQLTHKGIEMTPAIVNGSFIRLSNFTNTQNDTYTVVIYKGCDTKKAVPSIANLNGVYFSKEFYPVDFSKPDVSPMPVYQTTLYWKHLCLLNSKHDTPITFYTNDMSGTFKIIVQGVGGNDVVYGETAFIVKRK